MAIGSPIFSVLHKLWYPLSFLLPIRISKVARRAGSSKHGNALRAPTKIIPWLQINHHCAPDSQFLNAFNTQQYRIFFKEPDYAVSLSSQMKNKTYQSFQIALLQGICVCITNKIWIIHQSYLSYSKINFIIIY